jgi:hypothetical protein
MKHISPITRIFLLICMLLSMLALSPVRPVHAGITCTVTSTADDGSFGTLRDCIAAANSNPNSTINFSVTGTIITLTTGQLSISNNVTISGPGASQLTINGGGGGRIFDIGPGITVTISGLTVTNGSVATDGGGIRNLGSLTLNNMTVTSNVTTQAGSIGGGIMNQGVLSINNSTISSNTAIQNGGGIYHSGTSLTITNSTFSSNSATNSGGGIFSYFPLTINNSTFSDNDAANAGGGIMNGGTLTVNNSTFSHNSASSAGGGIYNSGGPVNITNSTLSANSAGANFGGGIYNSGSATLRNTIIANSTSGGNCNGTITDGGGNLVWGDSTCPGTNANPKLSTLGNFGGPTQTFALLSGSTAIDAGNDATCAAGVGNPTYGAGGLDQRGVTRPRDGDNNGTTVCDMGAFERKANVTVTYRSVGAYDGWVLESTETSNAGGTLDKAATAFYLGDDAADKQYRAILSFNTASLPNNATIIKVTLKIRKAGLVGTDPFTILGGLRADIRKPYFGTTLGLLVSDFQAVANRASVGTFATPPVLNWYSATIVAVAYPFINLTGPTQFRLRFVTDDDDDIGADYMSFFSGNYATVSARPTLIITYYVP